MQCCLVLVVPVSAFGYHQWHEVQCVAWAPCWDRVQGGGWSRGGECNHQGFGEDANCVEMTIVRGRVTVPLVLACFTWDGVTVTWHPMGKLMGDSGLCMTVVGKDTC